MAETMLALGDFVFGLDTAAYDKLTRTTTWNWASMPRPGSNVAKQYIGKGEDRVSLPGIVYPTFRGGIGQIEAMRVEANKGTPLQLIDRAGYLRGKWIIESIAETHSYFFADGTPRKMEFVVELVSYGEDAA